ncbi:GNAT family N-acetyltransferase [Pseudorhizobium endolithicum]|uniref:GNAT family N-acetyltransferase n=1 Tax=Pseudorhizobium endolithicum TaxID=1191678 RepID=A0ABN7JXT3_9HYPH|nr:hypothetical protein [Pseudorhizobium endolithicum]CAD7052874.1 GNAT family N-acetyltransferase [Pseudorhizobium endolithicum]
MAEIRALREEDIPAVAGLFHGIFRRGEPPPPGVLLDDLRAVYLEDTAVDPQLPSLVHVEDGHIRGFIGRHALPMVLNDRPLRMALCSSIMVDHAKAGPLAGAKLLKSALGGPQDLSFTDTASDVSLRMWRGLGAAALPQYSLDWIRVVNPAAALADAAAHRLPFLRHAAPLARFADRRFRRNRGEAVRWSGMGPTPSRNGTVTRPLDVEEFAAIFDTCTRRFAFRPGWPPEAIAAFVRKAMPKPSFGEAVIGGVFDRRETPIGAFFYHLRRQSTARVLQLLALPGQEGPVLDATLADAAARGASTVRGRMQPALMEAMLGRRLALFHASASIIHSRDPAITAACAGDACLGGLVGEQWSRLIGGETG